LRVIGRRAALVVFALDAVKGLLAVGLARLLPWPDPAWLGLAMGGAAVAAILGHAWSVWLRLFTGKWSGGRGVSTAVGAMFMVHPFAAAIALLIGVGVIVISRYVSLGSIIGILAGLAVSVLFIFLQQIPFGFLPGALLAGLLI